MLNQTSMNQNVEEPYIKIVLNHGTILLSSSDTIEVEFDRLSCHMK